MVPFALLLAVLGPLVALCASVRGGLGEIASPPDTRRARRRGPRVAAVVPAGSRGTSLGMVSQLVDHVDRVVLVHDESDRARCRLADFTGDPSIDLVSVPGRRLSLSRAQRAGLDRVLERHSTDVVLLVHGDALQAGDLVAALMEALPGHDAVVAARPGAPAPLLRRISTRLRELLRRLAGRDVPDRRWAALLLTCESLRRVGLDPKHCAGQLRREATLPHGLRVAWIRLPAA